MKKGKKLLQYFMLYDLFFDSIFLVLFLIVLFVISSLIKGEIGTDDCLTWLFWVTVLGTDNSSVKKYNEFSVYSYSRKQFYHYQVILSLLRGVTPAILQTILFYGAFDKYVLLFMEGTEYTFEMYHKLSILEFFISTFIVFGLLSFLYFLGTTITYSTGLVSHTSQHCSTQQQIKREWMKKNHKGWYRLLCVLSFLGIIIFLVIACIMTFGYFDLMLRAEFTKRCLYLAGIVAVWVIAYFLGRLWFTPKHI